MRIFREQRGLVRLSPFSLSAALSFFRYRSMDTGLMVLSFSAMPSVGRPPGDILHLPPHKGGEDFPAFVPEKDPDEAEGSDDVIGIDPFAFAMGGPFSLRFELYRLPIAIDQDFSDRLVAEEPDR
jgi:hypothetical protein